MTTVGTEHDGGDFPWHITLTQAIAAPLAPGARSALLLRHGTMAVRYYAPRGHDPQSPHDQDELYIVAQGHGTFLNAGRRQPFGPGDVLFAPAGAEHRFEDFSDDFGTWVVFYGPQGGESEA